jgi:hypothetical protein
MTLKELADEFIDLDSRPGYFLLRAGEGGVVKRIPKIIKFKI